MKKELTSKDFIDKFMLIEKGVLKLCSKERAEVSKDEHNRMCFKFGVYNVTFNDVYHVGNRFITLKSEEEEIWINTIQYKKEFVIFKDNKTHFVKEENEVEEDIREIYNRILFSNEPLFISMKAEAF